ncbi:helix-turn-helix transcriptional regulator [Yoonia sp.]|uniref:helix-turn-helix transcriptional regulator n=1 Tax=Yoonia sp. TaxID=2212373 RepID=UPI0025FBC456|nr:helix-turn-helix transcriptional regulator [Yoonia sp.]
MTGRWYVLAIVVVQVLCAVFFVAQILASVLGLAPISWQFHELIELGAALGLLLGVLLGWMVLRKTMARNLHVEDQLRLASGAFRDVMEERFASWGLTPAEHDVALFAVKGMSTQEIAGLRQVSEGTIKAQTNAIYRKAGVAGRPQLLSLFIDELMVDITPNS